MNVKQKSELARLVGPALAAEVEAKLKELKQKADNAGMVYKENTLLKAAGWSDLDRQRAAEAELARVQGIVDDFVVLSNQALAEGNADLSALVDELKGRLGMSGPAKELSSLFQTGNTHLAHKEKRGPLTFASVIKQQNDGPADIGLTWFEANEAYANKSAGGGLADALKKQIMLRRMAGAKRW